MNRFFSIALFLLIASTAFAQEVITKNIGNGVVEANCRHATETDGRITISYKMQFTQDSCFIPISVKTYEQNILIMLDKKNHQLDEVWLYFNDGSSLHQKVAGHDYNYRLSLADVEFLDPEGEPIEITAKTPLTEAFIALTTNNVIGVKINSHICPLRRTSARIMQTMIEQGIKACKTPAIYVPFNEYMGGGDAKGLGEKFLAENKTKPGVICTKSGLQYKVIKEGSGVRPNGKKPVKVNYVGRLISGRVFDKNNHEFPVEMDIKKVIKGFGEGLKLMTPGSKYMFYMPYELAYGKDGNGSSIPPYSALVFEVELIEIVQ